MATRSAHLKRSNNFKPLRLHESEESGQKVCFRNEQGPFRNHGLGLSPFEIVFGRSAVGPVGVALGYEEFKEMADPANFIETVQQWLQKAREIALKKVNKTLDEEAPRFDAKRPPAPFFEMGDLYLNSVLFLESA